MTDVNLDNEPLLDVEFALSLWGDEAVYQRLLRLSMRSITSLDDLPNVPSLEGDPLHEMGALLHKYAGRAGVVGLNRLAAALRAVDQTIREEQPCGQAIANLLVVLTASEQAVETYLAAKPIPYVKSVAPGDVDRQRLEELLEVFERAIDGSAGTSALDDAMEDLFDVVGEESAWPVNQAINVNDMDQMKEAVQSLRTFYLS